MAGVDATMFFVLDVLRNIGGETWTESWTTGATARLVRSSCRVRHTSSNVQLQAWTTERDEVHELQGSYLFFII